MAGYSKKTITNFFKRSDAAATKAAKGKELEDLVCYLFGKVPGLRIAFMSGYADIAAIEAAIGSGGVLLRKPFDLDELKGLLDRLSR